MSYVPAYNAGSRCVMKIGGVEIAYITGISASINMSVVPITPIGRYGPLMYEKTMLNPVTGTLQMNKIMPQAVIKNAIEKSQVLATKDRILDTTLIKHQSFDANGKLGEVGAANSTPFGALDGNGPLSQAALYRHMSADEILLSRSFDVDLYLKVPKSSSDVVKSILDNDRTNDLVNAVHVPTENANDDLLDEILWRSFKNCRITSRSENVSTGSLLNATLSWMGIYVTDYRADLSQIIQPDHDLQQVFGVA